MWQNEKNKKWWTNFQNDRGIRWRRITKFKNIRVEFLAANMTGYIQLGI